MTDINDPKELFGSADLSAMIEKLKEHPEIVTSVASTLGLGTPPSPNQDNESSPHQIPEMLSVLTPLISQKGDHNPSDDQRVALLLALRPYLSPERKEIIDYIIKFSKMGELIKKIK